MYNLLVFFDIVTYLIIGLPNPVGISVSFRGFFTRLPYRKPSRKIGRFPFFSGLPLQCKPSRNLSLISSFFLFFVFFFFYFFPCR